MTQKEIRNNLRSDKNKTEGNSDTLSTNENNTSVKPFNLFYPGKDFPAISITGSKCELDCAHCGGHYLNQMLVADSPERLIEISDDLVARGATGALISGGCDRNGWVINDRYLEAFSEIKRRTNLILNVHTGLMNNDMAKRLGETNIDVASVDIVGSSKTIKEVYGLDHTTEEYRQLLKILANSGIKKKIVPHICVGLDYGKIKGEYKALDMISAIAPHGIVFIVLIPTKGTRMADCIPPPIDDVAEVIRHARTKFKTIPLYLGCMRPRDSTHRLYNRTLERLAISEGMDGIVLPSRSTVRFLMSQGIQTTSIRSCCAVV